VKILPLAWYNYFMPVSPRTNETWISELRSDGDAQSAALAELRIIIIKSLPYALSGYLSPDHPEFETLLDEIAQETLLRVLDRMDTFEGRSQFTTWVHKIAIRLAFSELRRRRWKDISLDASMDQEETAAMPEPIDPNAGPEILAERHDILQRLGQLLREELTDKQRLALQAIVMQGMPMEEAARKMGMQRNALYKLLHDARKRLKTRLEATGLTPESVLDVFEQNSG
jgi:RNA polymerase sigma-70 factor (ECF subfamily)